MEDLELKELFRNLGIWLILFLVFGSLFVIILVNKFGSKDISINQKIDKKESLVILIVTKDTKNTKEIKNELKNNNISYEIIYRDRERYFYDFLKKVQLEEKDIVEPTIIYIENKEVVSILVDIKNIDEIKSFIEYNNLSGKGI